LALPGGHELARLSVEQTICRSRRLRPTSCAPPPA